MHKRIKVMVTEPSVIIRSGVVSVLKRLNSLSLEIIELDRVDTLVDALEKSKVHILIINPMVLGLMSIDKLRSKSNGESIKIVALQTTVVDSSALNAYNAVLSISDSISQVQDKFESIIGSDAETEKSQLSSREQEIVAQIARGLSNKQIADKLFLSMHTVTTHRRNIMNKLQIHSSAGLTIYAIANKIVDISEISL